MNRHGEYKMPGGKLVVADLAIAGGRLERIQISGDFFLEPDHALDAINAALAGLSVAQYGAMEVKRAVVGNGHAAKEQVQAMVRHLLPGVTFKRADAADALAVAICHAHHRQSRQVLARGYQPA